MSREETRTSNKIYYQVFDGAFRTRVRSDFPDAIERINKNGKQVFEREVNVLVGQIENVAFEDSDFGQRLVITLDANEEGKHPIVTFGVESKDGRDVMKKLPALDITKEVEFAPYKWTPEGEDKPRSGITISQANVEGDMSKVENFFWDAEKKVYKPEFPTIDWDTASDSQKKIYKIQRDEFLVNYTKQNVMTKFTPAGRADEALAKAVAYPKEDINPDDIPF